VHAPALGDRQLVARAGLALVQASVRYWSSVAPVVRGELRRWERRAEAIADPELQALALEKLHAEGFHAEAGAMLATIAPRSHRRHVVEAIVALELLFDYLDGLTERPTGDPLRDGEQLFAAYIDAVTARAQRTDETPGEDPPAEDGGYLEALSGAVSGALAQLPSTPAITEAARRSAARSAQAQIRMHGAHQLGVAQVEEWARREAEETGLGWRELLAGSASSVLAVHALVAAAADASTTSEEAQEIETAYLSTCVLLTLLDGLVDYQQDKSRDGSDGLGYLSLYEDREELSEALGEGARRAARQARELRNGAHHVMMLVGVVAYYGSDPGARSDVARPLVAQLGAQLRPLLSPTLVLMRGWRLAKRARRRLRATGVRAGGGG
jgi:tetraprenyl-beta-curcumene synthase